MTTIHSVTNISKETTEKELKLMESMPSSVLPDLHSLPKIENLLNSVEDSAPQIYQPLPEVSKLIKDLKEVLTWAESDELYRAPRKTVEFVTQAIEFLKNGEPFNPEPHPDSGQGKWKETAAFHSRNEAFYHGIVKQIGEILGEDAYTADDGSVGDSVLALKLPELVKQRQAGYERSPEVPDPDTND